MTVLHDFVRVTRLAQDLCLDTPRDSEYVRGQAELICDMFGITTDDKQAVIDLIADSHAPALKVVPT